MTDDINDEIDRLEEELVRTNMDFLDLTLKIITKYKTDSPEMTVEEAWQDMLTHNESIEDETIMEMARLSFYAAWEVV